MKEVFIKLHHDDQMSVFSKLLDIFQQFSTINKWMGVMPGDLKHYHFSSTITIGLLLVGELDTITTAVKDFTGQKLWQIEVAQSAKKSTSGTGYLKMVLIHFQEKREWELRE